MYSPGKNKLDVRNYVYAYLCDCETIGSLPNLYFELENLLSQNGSDITCFERDRKIFEQQEKIINPKFTHINDDILDSKYFFDFDGMFLDFCGPISMDILTSLHRIDSCKIAITLLMARETIEVQKVININNRVHSLIQSFQAMGFSTDMYIEYYDGSPMCTFFIRK